MRIVSGKYKGAKLSSPKEGKTRPTSDRVREAIFNILTHWEGSFRLEGAFVLDLFAGTGALGLEALSRGAKYCVFIDHSPSARAALRGNIEKLHAEGMTKVWRRDACLLGEARSLEPFDLVFADPPYGQKLGERAFAEALKGGWLKRGTLGILEEHKKSEITLPDGFELIDRRLYGDSQILFLQVTV